jgi:X-Pro dipeptidyl-peptidase
MIRRRLALVGVAAGLLLGLVPLLPARAADVYETFNVPTIEGNTVRVEVVRDPSKDPQPVLLTVSPYNDVTDTAIAKDGLAGTYNPLGIARATADVLGTRGSTGCWDYGGKKEQRAAADAVKFLAKLPWSNGKVGMIGVSYEGTTANMVAALGDEVPELKAIVPIASISRWYGYAYSNGVRYFGNSEVVTDEGIDTPILFDLQDGRTTLIDPNDPKTPERVQDHAGECGIVEHTNKGYDASPDYDQFWLDRDYLKDASKFRAAALVVHGWQDYNVKQEEGINLYEALPVDDPATPVVEGVPFKRLYMSQSSHADGNGPLYAPLLKRFLLHTLKGVSNNVEKDDPVLSLGRTADSAGTRSATTYKSDASWPPAGTQAVTLNLTRSTLGGGGLQPAPVAAGTASYVDDGTVTEEVSRRLPAATTVSTAAGPPGGTEGGWLYYLTPPLTAPLRMTGRAVLDLKLQVAGPQGHVTPLLLDVPPSGNAQTGTAIVSRGFMNLAYRDGLTAAKPVPSMTDFTARVPFMPQDFTFPAGHRIGLLVQSSNTVWAVPTAPTGRVTVAHGPGASTLTIPVVSPPATLF